VVGFDEAGKPYVMPALTTVRQPVEQLGVKAVETALALLRHEAVPTQGGLATELVVRASCGCPAATASPQTADPLEFSALHRAPIFAIWCRRLLATFNLARFGSAVGGHRLPHLGIPAGLSGTVRRRHASRLLAARFLKVGSSSRLRHFSRPGSCYQQPSFPQNNTLLILPAEFPRRVVGISGFWPPMYGVRDIHIYRNPEQYPQQRDIKGACCGDAQRAAQRELQAAYAEVEQRVAERTAELQHEIAGHRRTAEALAQEQRR
jgi:hypothetical protein